MKVLFEVTHPAHVHLFKHAVGELTTRGADVAVTSREKDLTIDLLDAYGIDHAVLSRNGRGTASLPREWVLRTVRLLRFARRFDPDAIVSRRNPASAQVAAALGVPLVMFHDTESVGLLDWAVCPLASLVCTPSAFGRSVPGNQRHYDGFQELAYLHPDRFEPDRTVLEAHGVDPDAFYAVLRFVSMEAFHDVGHRGFSPASRRELVEVLSERGPVYVTSEGDDELDGIGIPVPPEAVHHLLAFADIYVGDSGTMATESALLGTPTVRLDVEPSLLGNFTELAERGLMPTVTDEREALSLVESLSTDATAVERWTTRRDALVEDAIDVTGFIVDCVHEVAG